MVVLTSLKSTVCPFCSLKLKSKNWWINSLIGTVGCGVGTLLSGLLLIIFFLTCNPAILGSCFFLFAATLVVSWWVVIKYVDLEAAEVLVNQTVE
jgi:hypothetical protein